MKILLPALAVVAAHSAHAGSVEKVIVAAMELSDTASYTWQCSVVDDAQSYEIEGRKRSDGYTWQRQPMPKNIARRLGRSGAREIEAIFKDTYHYVIATEHGWKTLGELPKQHSDWQDGEWIYVPVPVWRSPDMPADESDLEPFGLPTRIAVPVIGREDTRDGRVYSNAQFALALPQDELAVIVSCHTSMEVKDNTATGYLNDTGAQLLLVHDGHEYITPVIAGGRYKLWLHEGAIAKYTIELAGIVVVERRPVHVRQKSTTVLKDVGTTTFEMPADARRRLAGG
jgi:hypothetical protein